MKGASQNNASAARSALGMWINYIFEAEADFANDYRTSNIQDARSSEKFCLPFSTAVPKMAGVVCASPKLPNEVRLFHEPYGFYG